MTVFLEINEPRKLANSSGPRWLDKFSQLKLFQSPDVIYRANNVCVEIRFDPLWDTVFFLSRVSLRGGKSHEYFTVWVKCCYRIQMNRPGVSSAKDYLHAVRSYLPSFEIPFFQSLVYPEVYGSPAVCKIFVSVLYSLCMHTTKRKISLLGNSVT